jgi:polyisoprenyl-phosphate glycosyltransferase
VQKKLISVVIPAYNEEDCVEELARRLGQVFDSESNYNFEVVIVENGSIDSTWIKLQDITARDVRFKAIKMVA